jgi:hypothetical protein
MRRRDVPRRMTQFLTERVRFFASAVHQHDLFALLDQRSNVRANVIEIDA